MLKIASDDANLLLGRGRLGSFVFAASLILGMVLLALTPRLKAQVPNPVSLAQVVDANHVPSPQMVADAARAINGVSPSTIPTQSITVGGFNGADGSFYFDLPGVYPPNLPDYKKCQTEPPEPPSPPGCVPPRYIAQINSFNVEYVFGIANKPPDFSISIRLPNPSGQMVSQPVSIDAAGHSASVIFHPYSFQEQFVSFTGTFGSVRRTITVSITPYLRPQLGAFVVKHLLLAIVYEPPGTQSSSSYSLSNTTGTTWSFDFTGGYGIVDTVDTGALFDTISKAAGGASGALKVLGSPVGWEAAGSVAPYVAAAGAVADVLKTLQGSEATTTTTVYTKGQSNSSGWSITVEKTYATGGVHKYPGHGDKFVFLDDVLFVYTVANNRVQLAPVAFAQDRSMTIDELQAQAPELAQKYGPLDLVLNPQAASAAQHPTGPLARSIPIASVLSRSGMPGAPRMSYFATPICEVSCPNGQCNTIDLTNTQYTSTGTSKTTTQTIFTVDTPSLMESMLGQKTPDQYYTTTYTTATQNWEQSAKVTSVALGCPEFAPTAHYVDLYIDYAFGTFLSILGPQVPLERAIVGTVREEHGQPAPRRQVALKLGGKNYVVFSDREGKFAIPVQGRPTGKGVVLIDKNSYSVDFSRGPIRSMELKAVGGGPASPGSGASSSGPCCLITAINLRTSLVNAKVKTSGQLFEFAVKDPALLKWLRIGQGIFADFRTRQVSLDGRTTCCSIVTPPGPGPSR